MPDNQLSDEALVQAFLAGDSPALTVLFERYFDPLKFYLIKISWIHDKNVYEDIIQQTFMLVLRAIKSGKFKPDRVGLSRRGKFKSYLFETCRNICWQENKKHSQCMPATDAFPKEPDQESAGPSGIPDDVFTQRDMDVSPYDYYRYKLQKVLPELNDEEKRLLILKSEGKSYKEIQEQDQVLGKHSIDYLMLMMYNIKKKINKSR